MLSSNVDPFDVARDEVEAAVRKVKFMHKEWRRLLDAENTAESQKFQELHVELLGELQQLDYDLQEVNRSIVTVEENRERFRLSDEQLEGRRRFMQASRAAHREIQEEMGGRRTAAKMEDDRRQTLLAQKSRQEREQQRQAELEDEAFRREQQALQRQLIESQEDELNQLSKTTEMLGVTAHTINVELEGQQRMLDELNLDIDMETQKMSGIMKGAGQVLKTSNKWQIFTIVGLVLAFFLMLWLLIFT
mmetsp:Transcript_124946/g.347880  ORF Transcript_124946/g.347880 Transcript_124946/m.347880 type:complete len:248 (+) Transcript_124946:126-869(+)